MGANEHDNPTLVSQAITGDQGALQRLLVREQADLSARIRSRLPKSIAQTVGVEDILQEAYTQAFRHIGAFQPVGPDAFRNWINAIADNVLRDAIRAQHAAKRGGGRMALDGAAPLGVGQSSLGPLIEVLATYDRTPSMSARGKEAENAVQAALAGINAEYREALTLRYLEGLPIAEVARRMGRTESAVHKVCARALEQLRDALGDRSRYLSR